MERAHMGNMVLPTSAKVGGELGNQLVLETTLFRLHAHLHAHSASQSVLLIQQRAVAEQGTWKVQGPGGALRLAGSTP